MTSIELPNGSVIMNFIISRGKYDMKKRLLSILLAACMLMAFVPNAVFSAAADGKVYRIDSRGDAVNLDDVKDLDDYDSVRVGHGEITGGTYAGPIELGSGVISGGDLSGTITVTGMGMINGGTFRGNIEGADGSEQLWIRNGVFYRTISVKNLTVYAGSFYGGLDTTCISPDSAYHTVSFDLNGGTGTQPVTQVFVATDEAVALQPEGTPTMTGHTFDGWYVGDTDTKYTFTEPVTESITLKARYIPNRHTVTFKLGNGEPDVVKTAKYGETIPLPEDPALEGNTFSYWDGLPGDGLMPDYDVTATAVYSVNSYKLTIVLGNGRADVVTNIAYGAAVNILSALGYKDNDQLLTYLNSSRTGYTFGGWNGLPEEMPAHNVTVTATWTLNEHTVTFKLGNGQPDVVKTVKYGEPVPSPANPTREGYAFTDWGTDVAHFMPDHDLTYTAKWRKFGLEYVSIENITAIPLVGTDQTNNITDLTITIKTFLPVDADAVLTVTLNGKTVTLAKSETDIAYEVRVDTYIYNGLAPYTITDTLEIRVYLDNRLIDSKRTSGTELCLAWMKGLASDSNLNSEHYVQIQKVVADLFEFCRVTSLYLGYTDTAATLAALMDEQQLTALIDTDSVAESDTKYISKRPAGNTRLMGVGLYFADTTGMYVRVKTTDLSRVTLVVTWNGEITTYRAADLVKKSASEYVLYLPGVDVLDINKAYHVSLCVDGQEIQYMDYAISDYMAITHHGSGSYSSGIRAVTQALYNWKKAASVTGHSSGEGVTVI